MTDDGLACPVPFSGYERVVLAHGGGGRVMHQLIDDVFRRAFADPELDRQHDGARLETTARTIVTTDGFTVHPLVFPGGDIGRLAVCGAVNDVAMCGGRPRWLTVAMILEEGLPLVELRSIVASMAKTATEVGVRIVTGDTKVVERGKGDGVFITVTAVGDEIVAQPVGPNRVTPGDAVIVSGPVGDHGVAVMARREGIALQTGLQSDVAPVVRPVLALAEAGIDIHCLRDPTRGGLATAIAEVAASRGLGVVLHEPAIPVRPEVSDGCELLGLDPLYVACEGQFVGFVPAAEASRALAIIRAAQCPDAAIVGEVADHGPGLLALRSALGTERVLDIPSGEQLPRIC